MPNRIIKETVCTSDTIEQLTWFEEVFFYRLIVNCDDYGRMDARPAILKARLFPLKTVTEKQIEDALNKLSSVGIVTTYMVEAKPYLQMVTWATHQTIRNKKSKFPSPDEAETASESNCNQLNSSASKCSRNPIQSESNPNPNPNPKGAVPDEILSEWNDYVEMRKKIKKPMTDRAARLALNKLNELAPNDFEMQKAILNQSIFQSWQGLFPLKGGGRNEQHNKDVARAVQKSSAPKYGDVL